MVLDTSKYACLACDIIISNCEIGKKKNCEKMFGLDEIKAQLQDVDPFKSWWPFIVAGVVFVVTSVKSYMSGQFCPNGNLITDMVVLITGSDGGIGSEIAKELSKRGGIIIMCCKDIAKGEKERKRILKNIPKARIDVRQLDLRSFDNVKRLVKSIGKGSLNI